MNIVYVSASVSEKAYALLYGSSKQKPAFQAQKYNRLFIEGLAHHTRVDAIGYPDAESTVRPERIVKLKPETVGNAHYTICGASAAPIGGCICWLAHFSKACGC